MKQIKGLVEYGLKAGLITEADRIYATNQILDVMKMDEYEEPQGEVESDNLELILKELLDAPTKMEPFQKTVLPIGICSIPV